MPVIGFIRDGSADANARNVAAFRKGLNETGYIDGQNVMGIPLAGRPIRSSALAYG